MPTTTSLTRLRWPILPAWLAPALTLLIGAAITLTWWGLEREDIRKSEARRFEALADQIVERIEDRRRVEESFRGAVASSMPYQIEYRLSLADGSSRWLLDRGEPRFNAEGRLEGYVGVCIDLTSNKAMEEQLRVSEARLRVALRGARVAVWDWNLDTGLLQVSENFREVLPVDRETLATAERVGVTDADRAALSGYARRRGDIPVHPLAARVHADDRERRDRVLAAHLTEGAPLTMEIRLTAASGKYRWYEVRGQVIADRWGTPIRMLGSLVDIEERKRAEGALRDHRDELEQLVSERTSELVAAKDAAEQANLAKSAFLANMSHELRTPMHAILSYSRLGLERLAGGAVESSKLQQYFDRIDHSGGRLLSLLNDLLDLSKLEAERMSYDMASHDLCSIVASVVTELELYARQRQVSIVVEPCSGPADAWCDPGRLSQVVRNLLSNAIKFTPEAGRARVSITSSELAPEESSTGTAGRNARMITVSDQGVGIPEAELEVIFDKFAQSSKTKSGAGGTGLGLSICHEIVNDHRGRIWARNNAQGGADFIVLIPVARGEATPGRSSADDRNEQAA